MLSGCGKDVSIDDLTPLPQTLSETSLGNDDVLSNNSEVSQNTSMTIDVPDRFVEPVSPQENIIETKDVEDVEMEEQIKFVSAFPRKTEEEVVVCDHIKIELQNDGWDIFRPNPGVGDYRYGSSIIITKDGMDAYFAAPGDVSSELDCIVHKHSDDNGKTWSDESVVLTPMPLSRDGLSVCDPDIFYYDGYYYLGYTGTMDASKGGVANSAFVARSESLDGPFEKWNGSGWGGDPVPLVYNDGLWGCWGVGEPAFVVKDDRVYVYCTKAGACNAGGPLCKTLVYTANIRNSDWPAHLNFEGYAVDRTTGVSKFDNYTYQDSDSWDVVYDDAQEKFIAISTNRRFLPNSCLVYYESNNGVDFERVSELNTNVYCGSHNAGLVSDEYGHIKKRSNSFLAYSYGGVNNKWGAWATRLVPVDIVGVDELDRSEDGATNIAAVIERGDKSGMTLAASVRSDGLVKYTCVGANDLSGSYSYRDDSGDVDKIDVDHSVSSDAEKSAGITVSHDGANRQVKFCVLSSDAFASRGLMHGGIKRFFSPVDSYRLSLSDDYMVCLRPLMEYNDYTLYEFTQSDLLVYGVTYSSQNPGVCAVTTDGILHPISEGQALIVVSLQGGLSFSVNVNVVG